MSSGESTSESEEDKVGRLGGARPVPVFISAQSTLPKRATTGAACYDITAAQSTRLGPRRTAPVEVRLRATIPRGYFLWFFSRTGLATKGVTTIGGIGDRDPQNNIKVLLRNDRDEDFHIQKGQRITQAVLLPGIEAQWQKESELTSRGQGRSTV